ncbi:MAG: hypothetical protein JWQ20_543 [Conexibacter sp.]|jgi:hypothetical protein|nr:hypothetical protein [Conexibacter sp.]
MASRREDRCGARFRRATPDIEPSPVTEADELTLTSLGQQFIESLRDDPRFRDVIADPFGDHGPAAA